MNILVTHVYSSDNKGDAALLSVLLRDINQTFPNSKVSILTLETINKDERFDGVDVYNSFMHFALFKYNNRLLKLFYSLYIVAATSITAILERSLRNNLLLTKSLKNTFDLYREADLIISVGGGYLRGRSSITSTIELALLVHPYFIARTLQKKTVLYPMSIGPFANAIQRIIIKEALDSVSLILVREQTTLSLLKTLEINIPLKLAVDSGFLFNSDHSIPLRRLLGLKANKLLIGITVRRWLTAEAQANFEKSIAEVADYLVQEYDAYIVFLPQVTSLSNNDDDRKVSTCVINRMRHKNNATVWNKSVNHFYVRSLYDSLDILIGTRFHSVIFSLLSYVPAIAIEYEHKTGGIMNELGLNKWVIKMEDVLPNNLIVMCNDLIHHKADYINHLRKVLPTYVKRADQTKIELRKIFEE